MKLRPPERVLRVLEADPTWPSEFERIAERVSPAIARVTAATEHIGSTSVHGLAAKPIIDVTIVLEHEADRGPTIDALTALGYVHYGDLGIPGRDALRHPGDNPPHNLYVGLASAPSIRNHLAVRNALRADPALVAEYSALKLRLAREHAGDAAAYTEGKSAFIARILTSAGFDQSEVRDIERQNRAQ